MLRDVVEEPNFTEEFDSLRNVYSAMDEVHAGLTHTLGFDPRTGTVVQGFPHPTVRLFKTTPIEDTPAFLVLYRYTADQVILLAIDRA
ncbi:MAG: hypothetical protein K8J31_21285 [Anaerolineae bacterium]|nr:hypothetical protein [Anaerolineae bacterium]